MFLHVTQIVSRWQDICILHSSFASLNWKPAFRRVQKRENLKYQYLRGYSAFCGTDNPMYSLNQ